MESNVGKHFSERELDGYGGNNYSVLQKRDFSASNLSYVLLTKHYFNRDSFEHGFEPLMLAHFVANFSRIAVYKNAAYKKVGVYSNPSNVCLMTHYV